jgi:DNA end-binding protein Ku
MRAIWTGAIGFGLVNIPVKMYSATQQSDLDLDMLDKKDHSNIRFKRVNESTGREIAWENIVKGYKLNGDYVILDEEDFAKASPRKSKILEISEFVNEKDVDSIYFETPYYIEPEKSGAKAYILLRNALNKSGKAGLGSFVLRTKESLCLVRPSGKILLVNKIRFDQEIRPVSELSVPSATIKPAELKMAMHLIDQLSGEFDISKYKDTYSGELLKIIKAKAKGKEIDVPHMKVVHSKAKDIMAQLKESIEGRKLKKAS